MRETGRGVLLSADSLLSKCGFDDGDCPDIYLDWLAEQGPADSRELESEAMDLWHDILRRLVRTRLMPLIKEDVVLYDIETIHNPIRAESVNGQPVVDYNLDSVRMLVNVDVTVPFAEVYELQRALSAAADAPPL